MADIKLLWPADTDENRITQPFNHTSGSLNISAPKGTPIKAITAGTVSVAANNWVQIASEQFVVTYIGLQNISVQAAESVEAGEVIAESGHPESIKLMVYQAIDPTALFDLTEAAPETSKTVYLAAAGSGVRIREAPVDGKPIASLREGEVVESLESSSETKRKTGTEGEWLHIRRADGTMGYAATWFLAIAEKPRPIEGNILGMNLDIYHELGHPAPEELKGIGWLRLKFNVSLNPDKPQGDPSRYGNQDIDAAYRRYEPFIDLYTNAGFKILMVFTHQLYGEGAGFDWKVMDSTRWQQLTATYADYARQVAQRFAGTGKIAAYQIWNEQDTDPGDARASVPMPAKDYAHLLTETIKAIRTVDPDTPIITGGHTTGPDKGSEYAAKTLAYMPADVRPDGIAVHPYGRGVRGNRYSNWGPLDETIARYSKVLPGAPLWITEWGVLDHQNYPELAPEIADYVQGFCDILTKVYPGKVATAIWYAWADSMDNGYGLVDTSGRGKAVLHQRYKELMAAVDPKN